MGNHVSQSYHPMGIEGLSKWAYQFTYIMKAWIGVYTSSGFHIFDDLVVLKNADAPSILFEAAVIVNPQDEARAISKSYKRGIAKSVSEMMNKGE